MLDIFSEIVQPKIKDCRNPYTQLHKDTQSFSSTNAP